MRLLTVSWMQPTCLLVIEATGCVNVRVRSLDKQTDDTETGK